jgi:hypothetical protein
MGEMRNVYGILAGKPEGKRPCRRHRHKWEDIIIMDFREIWWGGVDWMCLAQERDQWWAFVNTVMSLQIL